MCTDTASAQLVHVLGHLLQSCTENACNAAIAEQEVALRSREIIRRVSPTSTCSIAQDTGSGADGRAASMSAQALASAQVQAEAHWLQDGDGDTEQLW